MEITQAMLAIPAFAMNLAILAGGAVYLAILSSTVLVAMGVFIVLGAVAYRLLIRKGFVFLRAARTEEERLFRHFRALTEGVKELKLHRERRDVFQLQNIEATTENYRRHNVAAELRFIIANNWSHLLFFGLIGLILFLLPRVQAVSPQEMTGYIIATLYLMGPLSGLLGSLSLFGVGPISRWARSNSSGSRSPPRRIDDCPPVAAAKASSSRALELSVFGVTHRLPPPPRRRTRISILRPVNLTFRPGEVVFLVGGNVKAASPAWPRSSPASIRPPAGRYCSTACRSTMANATTTG